MAEANSSDEYRCHSCHNKNFKDFYHLLNHFQDESKFSSFVFVSIKLN